VSRVLISGYYGFGNAGDEAVLAAILASLRRQQPELECGVLSAAPGVTARLHGVPAFHRARPREVVAALRRCDLFVSGGGSLLQDVTSLNSLLFYLAQIRLARGMRRRVMVYAQGIGPLRRPAARRLTARVLRGVEWITVRDPESAEELRGLGLTGKAPPIEVTADPVFALAPVPAAWAQRELRQAAETRGGDSGGADDERAPGSSGGDCLPAAGPWIGISLREWPGLDPLLEPLAEVIGEETRAMGVAPVFFPLQRAQDAGVCRRVAERTGGLLLEGEYAPDEWAALAGEMSLFLGMRLHALIFAASRGVPVVGLAYDPKVTALLARLGETPAAVLPDFDRERVRSALREAWKDRARRGARTADAARELSAAAEQNARRAVELLARRKPQPVLSSAPRSR
jgi:polysaccharide pyruvyl transferase CsaB